MDGIELLLLPHVNDGDLAGRPRRVSLLRTQFFHRKEATKEDGGSWR